MRNSQPTAEKALWPKTLLALLRERFPDYELNPLARGTRTECFRTLSGLYVSQNTFCLHGIYHHCFALTLTPRFGAYLWSPFWLGARFDHNLTIAHAFDSDLNAAVYGPNRVPGLTSTHGWRTGTDDIVRKVTANAELHLLPHYKRELLRARPLLLDVLSLLIARPTIIDDSDFVGAYRRALPAKIDLSLRDMANPPVDWHSIRPVELPKVLVAVGADKFRLHLDETEAMYRTIDNLVAPSVS